MFILRILFIVTYNSNHRNQLTAEWRIQLAITDVEARQAEHFVKSHRKGASRAPSEIALQRLIDLVASEPEQAFWLYTYLLDLIAEKIPE